MVNFVSGLVLFSIYFRFGFGFQSIYGLTYWDYKKVLRNLDLKETVFAWMYLNPHIFLLTKYKWTNKLNINLKLFNERDAE